MLGVASCLGETNDYVNYLNVVVSPIFLYKKIGCCLVSEIILNILYCFIYLKVENSKAANLFI